MGLVFSRGPVVCMVPTVFVSPTFLVSPGVVDFFLFLGFTFQYYVAD